MSFITTAPDALSAAADSLQGLGSTAGPPSAPGPPASLVSEPRDRTAASYPRGVSSHADTAPRTVRSRRRGQELEHAMYDATLAELTAVGYGRLTMEGIAARAHTGKAALYRRWSSKHDLVQDALRYALPPLPELRADRSLREKLLTIFTAHRDVLAGKTAFPGLDIIGQVMHEPELRTIFADAVVAPRLQIIEATLRAAVDSGEIDAAMLTPMTPRIGPALINQQLLLTGRPPTRRELVGIVDAVIPTAREG